MHPPLIPTPMKPHFQKVGDCFRGCVGWRCAALLAGANSLRNLLTKQHPPRSPRPRLISRPRLTKSTSSSGRTPITPSAINTSPSIQAEKAVPELSTFQSIQTLLTGPGSPISPAEELPQPAIRSAPLFWMEKRKRLRRSAAGKPSRNLDDAAKDKIISPSVLASAKIAAGHAECVLADLKLIRIEGGELRIEHLLTRLKALTAKVQANNTIVDGLIKRDPKDVQASLAKVVEAATTGDQGLWIARDKKLKERTVSRPEDCVEKQIADLTKKIADLNTGKDGPAETKSAALMDEAGKFERQSLQSVIKSKSLTSIPRRRPNFAKTLATWTWISKARMWRSHRPSRALDIATAQEGQARCCHEGFRRHPPEANHRWVGVW